LATAVRSWDLVPWEKRNRKEGIVWLDLELPRAGNGDEKERETNSNLLVELIILGLGGF